MRVATLMRPRVFGFELFSPQRYFHVQTRTFELDHRFKPLHPRVACQDGNLPVQGTRYAFFVLSFAMCGIFELPYRVHTFPQDNIFNFHPDPTRPKFIIKEAVWFNTGQSLLCYDPFGSTNSFAVKFSVEEGSPLIECFDVALGLIAVVFPGKLRLHDQSSGEVIAEVSTGLVEPVFACYITRTSIILRDRASVVTAAFSLCLKSRTLCPAPTLSSAARCAFVSPDEEFLGYTDTDVLHYFSLYRGNSTQSLCEELNWLYASSAIPETLEVSTDRGNNNNPAFSAFPSLSSTTTTSNSTNITNTPITTTNVAAQLTSVSVGSRVRLDRNFIRLLPRHHRAQNEGFRERVDSFPPLLIATKSDFTGGISRHLLHALEPLTGTLQVFVWGPNEGLITGVGANADGKVWVCVSDGPCNLLFEFSVRPEVLAGNVPENPEQKTKWTFQTGNRGQRMFTHTKPKKVESEATFIDPVL